MPRAQATPLAPAKPSTNRVKRGANAAGNIAEARTRGIDTSNAKNAALVDVNKPLSDMQRLFVKAWASGESILAASTRAGYSDHGTYAYRMVRMPNILALYNAEKRAFEEAGNMTRKKVMDMLIEGYDVAKMMSEPASMVSAAREIGKMCGYYEPVTVKHQVTVEGKVVVERMNRMSDAELLDFIAKQTQAIRAEPQPAEPELLEDFSTTDQDET